MFRDSYHCVFKYIIVGDSAVGKSCMLMRFTTNKPFQVLHDVTIGAESATKVITVDNRPIKIDIWDTAGQEAFRSITSNYYRGAAVALFVYDVTRQETFKHIAGWLEDVRSRGEPNMTFVLVGNKCDKEEGRAVSREEGERFAEENGMMFMETSAKAVLLSEHGVNVEEVFVRSAAKIVKEIEDGVIDVITNDSGGGIMIRDGLPKGYSRWRGRCCS